MARARLNRFSDTNKKLGAKDLAALERTLGFELPDALAKHYLARNGGQPARRYLRTKKGDEYTIDRFLPIKHRSDDDEELVEDAYRSMVIEQKIFPKHYVPFAEDEGGAYFCMDSRDGSIVFVSPDHYDDLKRAVSKVARSLEELLASMVTEEEFYADD